MDAWMWIVAGVLIVVPGVVVALLVRSGRENRGRPNRKAREKLLQTVGDRVVYGAELVDLVRPYAPHERWLFDRLTTSAARLEDALDRGSDAQVVAADREFGHALQDVRSVAEAYPQLAEDDDFVHFSEDLTLADDQRRRAIRELAARKDGIPEEQWG